MVNNATKALLPKQRETHGYLTFDQFGGV